jgi:hypothetical protein
MGELQLDEDQRSTRRTVWRQDDPVKMMSFVVAKQHHEVTLGIEDLPEIAVFGLGQVEVVEALGLPLGSSTLLAIQSSRSI